jgi:hypothetical protein
LSGFGKSGIGACCDTCEQFHEFGVQSLAARGGEHVKRKKRHVGLLGQHVMLRRNVLPASAIFQPTRASITPLLALKSKKARACDPAHVSISWQEAEFADRSCGLPIALSH